MANVNVVNQGIYRLRYGITGFNLAIKYIMTARKCKELTFEDYKVIYKDGSIHITKNNELIQLENLSINTIIYIMNGLSSSTSTESI